MIKEFFQEYGMLHVVIINILLARVAGLQFTNELQSLEVEVGDLISEACSVNSNTSQLQLVNPQGIVTNGTNSIKLDIHSASLNDAGNWSCKASDGNSSSSHSAVIKVYPKSIIGVTDIQPRSAKAFWLRMNSSSLDKYHIEYSVLRKSGNTSSHNQTVETGSTVVLKSLKPNSLINTTLYAIYVNNRRSYQSSTVFNSSKTFPSLLEVPIIYDTGHDNAHMELPLISDENGPISNIQIFVCDVTFMNVSNYTLTDKVFKRSYMIADFPFFVYQSLLEIKVGDTNLLDTNVPLKEESTYVAFLKVEIPSGEFIYSNLTASFDTGTANKTLLILGCLLSATLLLFSVIFILVSLKRSRSIPTCLSSFKRNVKAYSVYFTDKYLCHSSRSNSESWSSLDADDFEMCMELKSDKNNKGYAEEFADLRRTTLSGAISPLATKQNNILRNRYRNVLPFEHSRVPLAPTVNNKNGYINANFAPSHDNPKFYIATQGPLQNTAEDFWSMIWEQSCHIIVMLCNRVENGRSKCFKYWPSSDTANFHPTSVAHVSTEKTANFIIRKFNITNMTDESLNVRAVTHFQFTGWPDFGIPENGTALLYFIRKVREEAKMFFGTPIVVHCSAGVGRAGVYISINNELDKIEKNQNISIYKTVQKIRRHRPGMVQTLEQYIYIHTTLSEYITMKNNVTKLSEISNVMKSKIPIDDLEELIATEYSSLIDRVGSRKCSHAESSYNVSNKLEPNGLICGSPIKTNDILLDITNTSIPSLPVTDITNRSSSMLTINSAKNFTASGSFFLDGFYIKRQFIIARSPVLGDQEHFWDLIAEYGVNIIVNLGQPFLTVTEDTSVQVNDYVISKHSEEKLTDDIGLKQIKISGLASQFAHNIQMYECQTSAEETALRNYSPFLKILEYLDTSPTESPLVVTSEDIDGRCGVLVMINNCLDQFRFDESVDVMNAGLELLRHCPHAFPSSDQYRLCYKLLIDAEKITSQCKI